MSTVPTVYTRAGKPWVEEEDCALRKKYNNWYLKRASDDQRCATIMCMSKAHKRTPTAILCRMDRLRLTVSSEVYELVRMREKENAIPDPENIMINERIDGRYPHFESTPPRNAPNPFFEMEQAEREKVLSRIGIDIDAERERVMQERNSFEQMYLSVPVPSAIEQRYASCGDEGTQGFNNLVNDMCDRVRSALKYNRQPLSDNYNKAMRQYSRVMLYNVIESFVQDIALRPLNGIEAHCYVVDMLKPLEQVVISGLHMAAITDTLYAESMGPTGPTGPTGGPGPIGYTSIPETEYVVCDGKKYRLGPKITVPRIKELEELQMRSKDTSKVTDELRKCELTPARARELMLEDLNRKGEVNMDITYDLTKVIKTGKANREKHAELVAKAKIAAHDAIMTYAAEFAAAIANGTSIPKASQVEIVQDQTKQYDAFITELDHMAGTTVAQLESVRFLLRDPEVTLMRSPRSLTLVLGS